MATTVQEAGLEFGVGGLKRHIFMCRGPDCCSHDKGNPIWKYLKTRLKELGLSGRNGTVYRSKVECLRICQNGPIVVVYPEGTWYHQVDEAKMERILQNHILQGKPLLGETFAVNPLHP